MLKRIQIKNFLTCQDVVIDNLGQITALVGRNGAGKTNILKAINWLARSATSDVWSSLLAQSTCEISVVLELENQTYDYTLKTSFDRAVTEKQTKPETMFVPAVGLSLDESLEVSRDSSPTERLFSRSGERVEASIGVTQFTISKSAPCMPAITSILPSESKLVQKLKPFLRYLQRIRYYPIDEPSDAAESSIVSSHEYAQWLGPYLESGNAEDAVIKRLLTAFYNDSDLFDEILSLIGKDGLGLIDRINIREHELLPSDGDNSKQDFYFVWFSPNGGSGKISQNLRYEQLSLGTRRVLRILVSLLFDKSSVALLEHPEDGIHRGLLRKLVDLIRTNGDDGQVILSSHSPALFDILQPEEVRLVSMQEGETVVRPLNDKELVAAKDFLEGEGLLSDFIESVEED